MRTSLAIFALLLPAIATGQTSRPAEEAREKEPKPTDGAKKEGFKGPPQEPRIRLALYSRAKLPADLDRGDAEVGVYRVGASADFSKFFGFVRLGFGISGERSEYDFSRSERLNSPPDPPTPGDPWDVLSFVRLNINALVPLGRSKLSVFAFAGVRFGWENGTEVGDGISASLGLAIGYRVDETLTLQLGFGLITRIEDSPFGFPLIGVRWKPSDWFRLETRGPGIELGLKPVESLELTLGVRYDNRQYRLEDRRQVLAEHIVEDQEVLVELGATFQPIELLSVRAVVGLVAYQEFEVRDDDGETRFRSRTDPAPYFELELALSF